MKAKGRVVKVDNHNVTINFDDASIVGYFEHNLDNDLGIEAKKWKENRTLEQNAMLWACIEDIAKATQNPDKWQIYLLMLKRYGKFTHLLVKPSAVDRFKKEWREVEELGEITTDKGEKAVQLRVFFGSHTYDTAEMSNLITGVIDEMKTLGLRLPPSKEIKELFNVL